MFSLVLCIHPNTNRAINVAIISNLISVDISLYRISYDSHKPFYFCPLSSKMSSPLFRLLRVQCLAIHEDMCKHQKYLLAGSVVNHCYGCVTSEWPHKMVVGD